MTPACCFLLLGLSIPRFGGSVESVVSAGYLTDELRTEEAPFWKFGESLDLGMFSVTSVMRGGRVTEVIIKTSVPSEQLIAKIGAERTCKGVGESQFECDVGGGQHANALVCGASVVIAQQDGRHLAAQSCEYYRKHYAPPRDAGVSVDLDRRVPKRAPDDVQSDANVGSATPDATTRVPVPADAACPRAPTKLPPKKAKP